MPVWILPKDLEKLLFGRWEIVIAQIVASPLVILAKRAWRLGGGRLWGDELEED